MRVGHFLTYVTRRGMSDRKRRLWDMGVVAISSGESFTSCICTVLLTQARY